MGLAFFCKDLLPQENVFSSVMLAVLKAGLFCGIKDTALKSNGKIEDLDIRRYFGNKEDDYEYFLMDIHETEWNTITYCRDIFNKSGQVFHLLAGTDNAPYHLCYNFSLHYLRLRPDHVISIYDTTFSLDDIEKIEQTTGYIDNWLQKINLRES